MNKYFYIFVLALLSVPMIFFGQSYSSLWNKVSEAEKKDLPKTQVEVLQKIVSLAEKERAYGQLLKAEILQAQVMGMISSDSLKPAVDRLEKRCNEAGDEVLKTVYRTVLYRIGDYSRQLDVAYPKPELTADICRKLADVKEKSYKPFVVSGVDSRIFDNDLLSIVGFELNEYQSLYEYYKQSGNRRAACLTAAYLVRQRSFTLAEIDSMLESYQDLDVAGELALSRYHEMRYNTDEEKLAFIRHALARWGDWKRLQVLRNDEQNLTSPQFYVKYNKKVVRPQQPQDIWLDMMRNIGRLTMTVYRVNDGGDIELSPDSKDDYQQIRPLLQPTGIAVEKTYDKSPCEFFKDTLTVEGLPTGLYMLEFTTDKAVDAVRKFYYVTDVYVMCLPLPLNSGERYVVVNTATGQPYPKARLRIKDYYSYRNYNTKEAKTDEHGEYVYTVSNMSQQRRVYAYTDTDKSCPEATFSSRYNYYGDYDTDNKTLIYTDRSIYRPGQTMHVAGLLYQVLKGKDHKVKDREAVKIVLRDANYKVISEKEVETDDYGKCTTDFVLPASGLTGRYSIHIGNAQQRIQVEEYKRPTFEVTFPNVTQDYHAGDTIKVKAMARSYAGVPVQGAKVKYTVKRRVAFWWWSYSRYWSSGFYGGGNDDTEMYQGETVTADDGTFVVSMPLTVPETTNSMFYTFVCNADVTDEAGETRSGSLSLPLGNRQTALSVDMETKILKEDEPKAVFHLRNAAGNDIDAQVRYQVDGGEWKEVKTNTEISVAAGSLASGEHTLKAVCQGDTVSHAFVLFSLDDISPATTTNDWFYQSASVFPNDGTPVTVQVGSSADDVHIVYSIFSGWEIIQSGAVDKSNGLLNLKLTYEEAWENGLLLTFAWVKDGICYHHKTTIRRPLPNKQLQMAWSTFRDRLTPGQQEEWTLTVKDADGRPVHAQLMATMYDKSLEQLYPHRWSLVPYVSLSLPSAAWDYMTNASVSKMTSHVWEAVRVKDLELSTFDKSVFPGQYYRRAYLMMNTMAKGTRAFERAPEPLLVEESRAVMVDEAAPAEDEESEGTAPAEQMEIRENLNETAFFYPQLTTDENGMVSLRFTLPESLATWRVMGIAHTADMHYGQIEGEAVAKKELMIQPNMPRFIRVGDQATINARVFNTGEQSISATAEIRLINPETNAVVFRQAKPVKLAADGSAAVSFTYTPEATHTLLICQTTVKSSRSSDGEQHYLPILPSSERVTVTLPFTQHEPGVQEIDLSTMIPADGKNGRLTLEYTGSPEWLMVQALPTVGLPNDENALSLAAAYYANAIGKHIVGLNPVVKTAFQLWGRQDDETSLVSALEQNQELKEVLLNETPWVLDANSETEQKQRLADFFDENQMQNRLATTIEKLEKLQLSSGSWPWWKGMQGSSYMTIAISEMLVRLNVLTGQQKSTERMLKRAFDYMGNDIADEVAEMKKAEKKGQKQTFPTFMALRWLYLCSLDGRKLPAEVETANKYLLSLLKKEIKRQTIYEKALTTVIFSKMDSKTLSDEYVQSLKEYTVYREDMGRYYDTSRASYSWYDYRIPTQTAAIEALQLLDAGDQNTIREMQRWLLQEKRAQAWDTPINSVNAVYAFLNGSSLALKTNQASFKVDGRSLEVPKATAAIGYVKTQLPSAKARTLTVDKTSEGTSWGAVYAQFVQSTKNIASRGEGITVKREVVTEDPSALKVGDRIKIRITIENDRDLDFVQVIDKRAACMEPVGQLSGYRWGYYCTPRDNSTNYYFDRMAKGKHVIETEYYVDRAGTYETGSCTAQCAYAPEFHGIAPSLTLKVNK